MYDYALLEAVAMVVREGSFERAARHLNITPSAVSQRVKLLEERIGAVLIIRGPPCRPTPVGQTICRHVERVALLESDLAQHLPAGSLGATRPVTLPVAVNADSLGTWFIDAMARFAAVSDHLLDLSIDDQDHTAERLRDGEVLAAVTGEGQPLPGCRCLSLGALRYQATASPAFLARYCPDGVTAAALARAPCLTFSRKDRLQRQWLTEAFGLDLAVPTHWLPSTEGFIDGCRAGIGWGLNPVQLAAGPLAQGELVELLPGRDMLVPLYWQVSRLAETLLAELTRAVVAAARVGLVG